MKGKTYQTVVLKNLTYRLLLSICKLIFLRHVPRRLKTCVCERTCKKISKYANYKIQDFMCAKYGRT